MPGQGCRPRAGAGRAPARSPISSASTRRASASERRASVCRPARYRARARCPRSRSWNGWAATAASRSPTSSRPPPRASLASNAPSRASAYAASRPGGGVGHPRLARQLGQQRAVEAEGLVVEPLGGGVVAGGQGGGASEAKVVEQGEVDVVTLGHQSIPARLGDQDRVPGPVRASGLELAPQLGHVSLQRRLGTGRGARRPTPGRSGGRRASPARGRAAGRPAPPAACAPRDRAGARRLPSTASPPRTPVAPGSGGVAHDRTSVPRGDRSTGRGIRPTGGPARERAGGRRGHACSTTQAGLFVTGGPYSTSRRPGDRRATDTRRTRR